jgi:alpha-1,2-mannosyltransferase
VVQIAIYNGRTTDAEHGPMVFGVEPWHFYPVNLFLNFNIAFILAIAAPFIIAMTYGIRSNGNNGNTNGGDNKLWSWFKYTSPAWLWLAIFMRMAHKEERFLFVIYPLLCLSASLSLSSLHTAALAITRSGRTVAILMATVLLPYIILSLSRTSALVVYYGAPLHAYNHVHTLAINHINEATTTAAAVDLSSNNTSICVGKEWYRFPSHFFLPSPYHLEFIKSDFTGLLPAHYEESTGGVLASSVVPKASMNDRNKEVMERYVSIDQCAYIVDLNLGQPHQYEPYYSTNTHNDKSDNIKKDGSTTTTDSGEWNVIGEWSFLDAPASHRLARAFYTPFTPSHMLKYRSYQLLKRNVM